MSAIHPILRWDIAGSFCPARCRMPTTSFVARLLSGP
jgi:hypothetical protein